jgi:hypothetical protein
MKVQTLTPDHATDHVMLETTIVLQEEEAMTEIETMGDTGIWAEVEAGKGTADGALGEAVEAGLREARCVMARNKEYGISTIMKCKCHFEL